MKSFVISIVDMDLLARSLDRYLHSSLGDKVESVYMTYTTPLLSGALFRQADLFILELFRRDDIGYRAEGIFAAERFAASGKRVLLISGATQAEAANCPNYWDLASQEHLSDRLLWLLKADPLPPGSLSKLKEIFSSYYRPAVDHHERLRQRPIHTST